ncbi:MAG: PAS domain-containing protein [Spirochaetia bacterium]|nr:PAS domain-containing protein [Spirochaetia bacterium]MCF7946579.1 PAS domain-containing protein [Spirochaetia bacterium]MCF7952923.1 PAS domain-containing protein [Spirochaetales bacterium]
MRKFIERAVEKLPKLNTEQIKSLIDLLLRENERFEGVLDSLYDGIIVTDNNHRIIMINKSAHRLLPIHPGEQEFHLLWTAVNDDDIADFLHTVVPEGDKILDEEFYLENCSNLCVLSISVFPFVREKQVEGSIVLVRDITEKKKQEARFRRAENLASLTTLAAGVAHEIKNPLASIGIHLQLMRREVEQKRYLEKENVYGYLDVIDEEIERLNSIVVDFLFAVRPMDTRMKSDDLNALLQEMLDFVKYELEENKISLTVNLLSSLPKVEIDAKYLKQALLNIIKNAIGAMPEGGNLKVSTEKEHDKVNIYIQDNGVGIPEKNMSKIFEPYFTTKDFGSGLGLTVVYKVIKEHQGDISINSIEGKGTTFTISLPLPRDERTLIDWQQEAE